MRASLLALIACVSIAAAQPSTRLSLDNVEIGVIGIKPLLRTVPPASSLARRFAAASNLRDTKDGRTFLSRVVLDRNNHLYLGYELLVEQRAPGTFMMTFGQLGLTPLEIAFDSSLEVSQDQIDSTSTPTRAWTKLQSALPQPQAIRSTDTVSVDLFIDPATGEKLVDEIRIVPPYSGAAATPPVPTVSGIPREFSASDAELQIVRPRVSLNRSPQDGFAWRNVHGPLVWFYFPGHGRYILSLLPRADLGFKKVGEVRGGLLTFSYNQDTVRVDCLNPIAGGDAYNLYVLQEEDWAPISTLQKSSPSAGTIAIAELAALKRR